MLHFEYNGKNRNGKNVTGKLDAVSKEAAISILKKKGITVTTINVKTKQQSVITLIEEKLNINKPTTTDMVLFSKQMHTLLKAGVPIIRSIKIVSGTVKNERLESALEDISKNLEGGLNLSQSIRKHPDVFPSIMFSLIEVGENTGALDLVFLRISEHLDRENTTKKQIKSALRYPSMVVVALIVAIAIMNIVVIPTFATFFSKFNAELPLATRVLIASSAFTINYWHLILGGMVIVVVSWFQYTRTKQGKLFWGQYQLKIPFIGPILEKAVLARFSRSFSLTSRSGVPLLDSIELIGATADNDFVSERVSSMSGHIQRGETLAAAAMHTKLFPPLVLQMISIGEETGEIDRLLDDIADFYESELDYELKKLSESIEPVLIGFVAVLVLILALGVFLPMWDISNVALGKG